MIRECLQIRRLVRSPFAMIALLTTLAIATGCKSDPMGSCESTQKNDATNSFCLDNSKKSECEAESTLANHVFDTKACTERGYKKCGQLPMFLKKCPE